jgi:type VI secretion system protein ImpF
MSQEQLDHHNQISFRITGQIWAQPVPIELLMQTHMDLETGRVEVKELTR